MILTFQTSSGRAPRLALPHVSDARRRNIWRKIWRAARARAHLAGGRQSAPRRALGVGQIFGADRQFSAARAGDARRLLQVTGIDWMAIGRLQCFDY